jgi:HMG box factor
VPISDAYAPVDHWQWMATLWRGIVGADLVIYVTGKATAGSAQSGEDAVGSGVGAGAGAGSVEVRSSGLVVVKVPVVVGGQGQGQEQEMVVDEKMERRLGFEVVEWVRGSGWVNASREAQMHGMEY